MTMDIKESKLVHREFMLFLIVPFLLLSFCSMEVGAMESETKLGREQMQSQSQSQGQRQTGSKIQTKLTSGLYWEDLPSPIFYESYIPLILEFKTPGFNKTEVTFNNWYNCTSEIYPYALSCPIVFHLNSAIQNLHIDFESLAPGKNDQESPETLYSQEDYFYSLTSQTSFCHRIQSHFPSIYAKRSDFDGYLKRLELCSNKPAKSITRNVTVNANVTVPGSKSPYYYIERNLTDYRYNIRFPFSKIESNFYDKFYRPVATASDIRNQTLTRLLASAVLSNSRTALQGSLLASFYAERNRWNFALKTCQSRKLPANIVTEEKLISILRQLKVNLTLEELSLESQSQSEADTDTDQDSNDDDQLMLSIPITSMSKYFSLPLTDCTHTEDELIVRILVPLTTSLKEQGQQKNQMQKGRYTLRSVHPIPFIFEDQLCKLKYIRNDDVYLYDRENEIAYLYDVDRFCEGRDQGQGLCSVDIPSLTFYSEEDFCVGAIFRGDIGQLRASCQWECNLQRSDNLYQSQNRSRKIRSNSNSKSNENSITDSTKNFDIQFKKVSNDLLIFSKAKLKASSSSFIDISSVHLSCEHTAKFIDLLNETRSAISEYDGAINFEFYCAGCTLFIGQSQGRSNVIKNLHFKSGSVNRCNENSTLYSIYQSVPWSLLKRDKYDEILKIVESKPYTAPSVAESADKSGFVGGSKNENLGTDLSQSLAVNADWKTIVDFGLINFLVHLRDFESAASIQSHSQSQSDSDRWWPDVGNGNGNGGFINAAEINANSNDDIFKSQGQGESGLSMKLLWIAVIMLLGLVIVLIVVQLLMMKKLRDMEGKSYFPSVPDRVSYRRGSPILLMQDQEVMDHNNY